MVGLCWKLVDMVEPGGGVYGLQKCKSGQGVEPPSVMYNSASPLSVRWSILEVVFRSFNSKMPSDNRGPEVLGVAGTFLALTTVAIALRIYCRMYVVKLFGWDDWFALTSWVRLLVIAMAYVLLY